MKYALSFILVLVLLAPAAGILSTPTVSASGTTIPTFSIKSVVQDQSVTITTYNFPANDTFEVLMGLFGTRGVNGIKVATTYSGNGGSFTATYTIPAALHGLHQIAIRLQSTTGSGYYAYNWFYNNTTGVAATSTPGPSPTPKPIYYGNPTFSILSVVQDQSVTIQAYNLPPNDSYTVTMGAMGTRGINGILVATSNSGKGGTKQFTYTVPAALFGSYQIAIRMQSPTSGYFAYNWFYNNTTGVAATSTPGPSPTPIPIYYGYPTFSILSVVRNQSVTIQAYNLPPNDSFTVTMGAMGTRGINGILVATTNTGKGGTKQFTYTVPAALSGSSQIAIRMQSLTSGYFAYNWFYNNTTQ